MKNRQRLEIIEMLLHRLDAAVVVRDPGNAHSADAYDGLRKQIIQSGKNHRIHVAHLLSLADSMERGADIQLVRDRVNDFLSELGVERVSDTSFIELFQVTEGEGTALECIEPAIIEKLDNGTATPIRLGKARRVAGPEISSDNQIDEDLVENQPAIEIPPAAPQRPKLYPIAIGMVILAALFGFLLGNCDGNNEDKQTPDTLSFVETTEAIASTSSYISATTTVAEMETTTTVIFDSTTTGGK
jgi:hypothetical protein